MNLLSQDESKEECETFGHWILDNNVCVKCNQEVDLENEGYVRIEIRREM